MIQTSTVQPADPVLVPAVVKGVDWVVLVPVIVTGFGILIGQVLTFLTARRNEQKTSDVAVVTDQQTVKLQRIEVLVDGRYGEVLQELADVKRLLAAESGKATDLVKAETAQARADEQAVRVRASVPEEKPTP